MEEFKLQTNEQGVSGLRAQDGRLTLRPTLAARCLGVSLLTIGVILVIVGAAVRTPATIAIAVVGALGALSGWRVAVARVVADANGIEIKNHWRLCKVGWDEIESMGVEIRNSPFGRLPYSSPLHPPHKFSCGVIKLKQGTSLVPDALVSLPAQQVGDLKVAAEVKVAVLSRFADRIGRRRGFGSGD